MADNTPVMIPDTSCETVEKSREIDIGRECRRLAIAVGTAIALHSSPTIAQTAPVSPSTSASATADKGGGQVVTLKDGKQMSFAEIARLPQEQQDAIIGEMTGKEKIFYGRWYTQVANQEADRAAIRKQAAIEDGKKIDTKTEAAINEIIQKIPQIIPVYEQKIIAGQRLTIEQKETLIYILSINKPPEWMPRVQKLLANPQNFA